MGSDRTRSADNVLLLLTQAKKPTHAAFLGNRRLRHSKVASRLKRAKYLGETPWQGFRTQRVKIRLFLKHAMLPMTTREMRPAVTIDSARDHNVSD